MAIKSSDQITIVDITDAYNVMLTSEAYTFIGSTTSAKAGSCTTQIVAMCGAEIIPASVTVSEITKPNGVTVTKDNDGTSPTLTISVDTSVKDAGEIVIPVKLNDGDITIVKKFSFAIAFVGAQGGPGATGKGVKSTAVTYQAGTSGTNAPTGTWQTSIPTVAAGQYLWTRTIITYTDNSTSTSYAIGKMGEKGATGAPGADAITMSVTSSAGTIFKNSSVATTLTAHVYKAGRELSSSEISALGTVKWYKDGSTTASATGITLSISAGDVTNKANYVAQLEG